MTVNLVPVEVGVVRVAVGVMHPDRLVAGVAEDSHAVSHDARLVERRLSVDQHAVPVVQMPPNLCKFSGGYVLQYAVLSDDMLPWKYKYDHHDMV